MKPISSKYFTIPNYISIFRMICTVVILKLWFTEDLFDDEITRVVILIVLFVIGSLSDLLDGYWARKYQEKTKVGAFLDSFVDKFFTLSFFISYLYIDFIKVSWILILLIVIREVYVTGMRIYVSLNNQVMVTEKHGKMKVTLQMIFQGTMWMYLLFYSSMYETKLFKEHLSKLDLSGTGIYDLEFNIFATFFSQILGIKQFWIDFIELSPNYMLAVVTLFTVYSGITYIIKNRRTQEA